MAAVCLVLKQHIIDVLPTALIAGLCAAVFTYKETIARVFSAQKRLSARPTCKPTAGRLCALPRLAIENKAERLP